MHYSSKCVLRDFDILVAAQAAEYEKTVREAQAIIDQAKAEVMQAVKERDEARAVAPKPPPGPVSLSPLLKGGPWGSKGGRCQDPMDVENGKARLGSSLYPAHPS